MNIIDIVLGGLILFGAVRGFMKGFFVEVASLLALILGIYGAIHFSYIAGDYLSLNLDWKERSINLTAFAITFVVIIILVSLAGKILTRIVEAVALGILNRLLGAIFGAFKTALILGIVIAFFDRTSNSSFFIGEKTAEKSVLYAPVKGLGEYVFVWALRAEESDDEDDRYRRYEL